MRRLLPLAIAGALLGATVASAQIAIALYRVYAMESQSGTRAVPAEIPCDAGISLDGLAYVQESIQCSGSQAITAGKILHFTCDPSALGTGVWQQAGGGAYDYTLSTTAPQLADSGYQPTMGPTFTVGFPFGRWLAACSGCTCSSSVVTWDGGVNVFMGGSHK